MTDRAAAIRIHRAALLRIAGQMFAMLGIVMGARWPLSVVPERVARRVWHAVLETLRPAEAAVRRLIVMASHGITVRERAARGDRFPSSGIVKGRGGKLPAFPLFDRRKRLGPPSPRQSAPGAGPRITAIGLDRHVSAPARYGPMPDDPVDAAALLRRLLVLKRALDELPREARRLARAMASRRATWPSGFVREPMRRGRPPGHRGRGRREIDEILRDCQILATWTLHPPTWWSGPKPVPP